MYRKLVISGMCMLALMTLCVSAQQQPANNGSSSSSQQPSPNSLLQIVTQTMPLETSLDRGVSPYGLFGSRAHREEMENAQKSAELVKQLAKAEGDKKDKIKDQLTETLGKQFDARQKRHDDEIKALEDQVKKLKELVKKRQNNRREIISQRLEQLVREAEGLGW
jgi:hypothetical protein